MKNVSLSIVVFAAIFLSGCATTRIAFEPVLDHGVWKSENRDRVFDGCVGALHTRGYMIRSTDRSSGVISTEWTTFYFGKLEANYRMNFLVSESMPGTTAVSVKFDVNWNDPTGYGHKDTVNRNVNNRISQHLRELFTELERMLGNPVIMRETYLEWR